MGNLNRERQALASSQKMTQQTRDYMVGELRKQREKGLRKGYKKPYSPTKPAAKRPYNPIKP